MAQNNRKSLVFQTIFNKYFIYRSDNALSEKFEKGHLMDSVK